MDAAVACDGIDTLGVDGSVEVVVEGYVLLVGVGSLAVAGVVVMVWGSDVPVDLEGFGVGVDVMVDVVVDLDVGVPEIGWNLCSLVNV